MIYAALNSSHCDVVFSQTWRAFYVARRPRYHQQFGIIGKNYIFVQIAYMFHLFPSTLLLIVNVFYNFQDPRMLASLNRSQSEGVPLSSNATREEVDKDHNNYGLRALIFAGILLEFSKEHNTMGFGP